MHKWKLMISTLPVPVAAIVIRFLLEYAFQISGSSFPGIMDFSALSPVLTGGVFLIGLMLSGTLQDYKESEKIPADLACSLETLDETVSWVAANRPAVSELSMREVIAHVADELYLWLLRQRTPEQGFAALSRLNELVRDFDKLNAGLPAARLMAELHNLRKTVTRIGVISRTGFLASGYALLDILVGAVLILLLIASYKAEFGTGGKYIIIGFVALIYSYLWRLVKDVDDPFEYSPTGERNGAAEVELFPLTEYRQRARARLLSLGSAVGADSASAEIRSGTEDSVRAVAPRPARRVVIGLSVLLLLIGGVALWRLGPKLGPKPRTVSWRLSSVPPGAAVFAEDGQRLGQTPLTLDAPAQPGARLLLLRQPDYQETRLLCHRDTDCIVDVVLVAAPPPPPPAAAPPPPPPPTQESATAADDEDAASAKKRSRHHRRHKDQDSAAP